ncbi:MAG TPA: YfiR/HmsC family protein [Melioribacteraceae bacterium]|nr:YfiR/HmsC family protein [Melioribacteraceae bacterium]
MKKVVLLFFIVLILVSNVNFAQKEVPANQVVPLTIKVLALNKSLKGNIKIYVLGNDAIANELKKNIGNTIVAATISAVDAGSDIPAGKYDIIYVCNASKVNAAKSYAKQHKSLTITNIPTLAFEGITLGFGLDDDKKQIIFLNLSSSSEQGMEWNPAIMKVAQTIKN